MTVHTCAGCSTRYALDLPACPHCGSTERRAGGAVSGRLPLFLTIACGCGRAWNLRLAQLQPGLVGLPSLFCASCGSQVQVTWPLVEDDMPKITRHGGPSYDPADETSPVVAEVEPLAGAEAGQGHSSSEEVWVGESGPETVALPAEPDAEPEPEPVDYDSMTLAELKAAADERGVASYGTKKEIAARLRAADQEG